MKEFEYKPIGVCSSKIKLLIEGDILKDLEVIGGCSGNLQGIKALVKDMKLTDIKDKLKGIIDEDMFLRQYNLLTQEKSKMKDEKQDIELKLYQLKNKISSKENEQYKNIIETYLKLKKPSRELLSALIDKIVVDKEQNIEIYYNFKPLI